MISTDAELGRMSWGFSKAYLFSSHLIQIVYLLVNRLNHHVDALNYVVMTQNCWQEFFQRDWTGIPSAVTHTCSLFTHRAIMQLHCSGFPVWAGCLHTFWEVPVLLFTNGPLMAYLFVLHVEKSPFSSCLCRYLDAYRKSLGPCRSTAALDSLTQQLGRWWYLVTNSWQSRSCAVPVTHSCSLVINTFSGKSSLEVCPVYIPWISQIHLLFIVNFDNVVSFSSWYLSLNTVDT